MAALQGRPLDNAHKLTWLPDLHGVIVTDDGVEILFSCMVTTGGVLSSISPSRHRRDVD
ncbi:MAG: hypothetical protein QOH48_956 [Actinomycetota bacterium]|nr:hypothetical protein [Actinomycetota bacterium]